MTHALANDAATLVFLAGQNVVTPEGGSRAGTSRRQPDRLISDFDPRRSGGLGNVAPRARRG